MPERVPVLAPHRARQRAGAVAQLEPHAARGRALKPNTSPKTCTRANSRRRVAQPRRVVADRERPRERGAGDARPGAAPSSLSQSPPRARARRRRGRTPHGTASSVSTPTASNAASRSGSAVGRGGERHRVDQLGRERGGGALAVAAQERLLALARGVAVAGAVGQLDVEVLLARAHRAEVEGQPRAHGVARRVEVVARSPSRCRPRRRCPRGVRPAFSSPRSSGSNSVSACSGLTMNGSQPSAISPTCSTAFGPTAPR